MNTVMEIIKERRSIRKFKPDMVSKDLIEKVMEAGLYAPSGMNAQVPITIAVMNPEKCNELRKVNAKIWGGRMKVLTLFMVLRLF